MGDGEGCAGPVPWSTAWQDATLGPDGLYRRENGRAERHFVTPVMADDRVARRIVERVAAPLAEVPGTLTVTDAGAADGTLLAQLRALWPETLRARTRWRGIDLRERPPDLPSDIDWRTGDVRDAAPDLPAGAGVLVAHELLDDLPCDIVEPDDDGALRLVLVDVRSGSQVLGPLLDDASACAALGVDPASIADWCGRWWPRHRPAARIEVGLERDTAWRALCSTLTVGVAIAVDYAHVREDRVRGAWDGGTLAGYLDGHVASARPDGSRNLTAHVALDACAAAVPGALTRLEPSPDPDDYWWLEQWMTVR